MGSQTQQQSGGLNGGSDVVKMEANGEASMDVDNTSSDSSKPMQSAATRENGSGSGADEVEGDSKEKSIAGSLNELKSSAQNGNPAATSTVPIKTEAEPNPSAPAKAPASAPPPPVLKGTLSYNIDLRRHLIRGMWNYENSNALPPQRFELLRTLEPDEDPTVLPTDGEFHGSFSLAYFHTTSKGRQKERSKVIPESGVRIKFTKVEDEPGSFLVDGKGTNQFGIFHINGTAHRARMMTTLALMSF